MGFGATGVVDVGDVRAGMGVADRDTHLALFWRKIGYFA